MRSFILALLIVVLFAASVEAGFGFGGGFNRFGGFRRQNVQINNFNGGGGGFSNGFGYGNGLNRGFGGGCNNGFNRFGGFGY